MLGKTRTYAKGFIYISLIVLAVFSIRYFTLNAQAFDWFKEKKPLEKLTMLSKVLYYVKDKYVDPSKVDPQKMFDGALEVLEERIPEVIIKDKNKTYKEITVGAKKMEIRSKISSISSIRNSLVSVLQFINENKSSGITEVELETMAVTGVLNNLDPHSILMSPEIYNETKMNTRGSFGGLGIIISIRKGKLTIISPIDDTPAYRAGLKAGDNITKIEDESTINMTLSEAVDRMRGQKGTSCTITVTREGFDEPKAYKIVRDIIIVKSVESHPLDNSIGYIRIKNFQNNTHSDVYNQMKLLETKFSPIKGLIIDMRSNPGGLLDQSIKISDLFLKDGTIVTTVGAAAGLKEVEKAIDNRIEPDYPIVVLVDGGSASASEIVAAALKNNNKAIVLGRQTFGKGSVQTIYPLPDDYALKLTIAEYLTPGDKSIQSLGIMPDIRLVPVRINRDNMNLFKSERRIREEDLDKHFEEKEEHYEKPLYQVKYFIPDVEEDQDSEVPLELKPQDKIEKVKNDFEVQLASKILASAQFTDRELLLKSIGRVVKAEATLQQEKIKTALKGLGISWDEPAKAQQDVGDCKPPSAKLEINSGSSTVKSGNEMPITVTLMNKGKCTLYKTWAISESDNPFFANREFIFGTIKPGDSKSETIKIKIPKVSENREISIAIKFDEQFGNMPTSLSDDFTIEGLDNPSFAFNYQILDDGTYDSAGNGNGQIERGEKITLLVSTKNIGSGTSEENIATLRNVSDKGVLLLKGREALGELKPGEIKNTVFGFTVRDYYLKNEITLELSVYDTVFKEYLSDKITLKVSDQAPGSKKIGEFVALKGNTAKVYSYPALESPVIAFVKNGAVLKATRIYSDFYKVDISDSRSGWMLGNDIKKAKEVASLTKGLISFKMKNIPPTIQFVKKDTIPLTTKAKSITVKGELSDDDALKDMYVLVNNKKVFYKSLSPSGSMKKGQFEINIKLDEGRNDLVFVARDKRDMISQKRHFITRLTSKGLNLSKNTSKTFRDDY